MRKAIFAFVVLLVVVVPIAVRASVPEAVAYLKTQAIDDWSAQALVAAGETSIDVSSLQTFTGSSATDYAKRILALVAAGEEPHTYTGTDLVAGLKALASGGQIGDATLLNDDAWLVRAGTARLVPMNQGWDQIYHQIVWHRRMCCHQRAVLLQSDVPQHQGRYS